MQVIPLDLYEDLEQLDSKTRNVILKLLKFMGEIVKREDFLRLEAQVEKLANSISELAEAQKRTDQRISELVEAQKRTEEEVRILAQEVRRTREEMGGLSLSFSYALENEAYRKLPDFLKRFGIDVMERLIRTEIGGKEINFFGKAKKDGKTVFIVGEAKIRLDDTKRRRDVFKEIEEKIAAVKKEYGDEEIVPLLVTHFATKSMLKKAKEKGILVVQSFEW